MPTIKAKGKRQEAKGKRTKAKGQRQKTKGKRTKDKEGKRQTRRGNMPEFHAEPYVYLAGLSHNSALIAWGAFYFRTRSDGRAKLVDDEDLQWVHPPRCDSIGCRSSPY